MIDTTGIETWKIVQALYNRAKPQGLGFLQYQSGGMSDEDAKAFVKDAEERWNALPGELRRGDNHYGYIDYMRGRVVKANPFNNPLDPRLFDRDNGQGACAEAINALRSTK